ncbi:MAG: HNH endonuclease [Candidatus Binatia bacterium]
MPKRLRLTAALRQQVIEREKQRCAYCRSPMLVGVPMVVDHIVPLTAGGTSTLENLCLACYRCNEFKGSRTTASDPTDGQQTALFHPRQQQWRDHFTWQSNGEILRGLTPCGRATIETLRLNNNWLVQARRIWMRVGLHPPLAG